MKFGEFTPEADEPQAVLILPNHLGSTFESDFSERSQQIANGLGMLVVAYERPGIGKQARGKILANDKLGLGRYADAAKQTGEALEKRLASIGVSGLRKIMTGNSAAAAEAVLVAYGQTTAIDTLVVADTVGMQAKPRIEFARNWIKHLRQDLDAPQADPTESTAPSWRKRRGFLENKAMLGRAMHDHTIYGELWRSDMVKAALSEMAGSPAFYDMAAHVAFVEHSFANSQEDSRRTILDLNGARPAGAAPFVASFMPDLYHSHFDDADAYVAFINASLVATGQMPDSHV